MAVLMISPGYPPEMPFFARGLSRVGVPVLGIGDSPAGALPPMTKAALTDYLQVASLWDEDAVIRAVQAWEPSRRIVRVECLWEPGMILAARLREALGLGGMTVEETVPFRDKEDMKLVLDGAGIRTPHHRRARTSTEVSAAAESVGYPLIVKPIAGAGSADTYRVDGPEDLERVQELVRHVPEVSVEEFIDGEEFTYDTICAGGEILFENISSYRPRPLIARQNEWISPQTVVLKDIEIPYLAKGRAMGRAVLEALGFRTGFTHMEWFRKPDGEAVFGEIAARPPGALTTEIMNYACDVDIFEAWAEAVVHGRISQPIVRKYNAGMIVKRAQGQGRIQRIEGLDRLVEEFGDAVVSVDLLPVGTRRRNWKQTLLSDGWLIIRDPSLDRALEMLDRVGTDLQIYAG